MDEQTLLSRITQHAHICNGQPTLRGMRYQVNSLVELLGAGMSFDELLADFPDLEWEDLAACVVYADKVKNKKTDHPLAS